MIYTLIGIACVTLIGFIAHRVGICLVRAVKMSIERDFSLLLAILLSGLWAAIYILVADYNQWQQPFERFAFHPLFAVGGFIFGLGASVNQGCSVSTMHQFARGNLSMIFTMLGWFIGWCLWMSLSMTNFVRVDYIMLAALDINIVKLLFGLSVVFTMGMLWLFPKQRERWFGIALIGLLVSVLFHIEPMWAPSKLIQDIGSSVFEGTAAPSFFREVLVVMLLLGMWLSVLLIGNMQLRWPTPHKLVRHSVAGNLMGVGGAMALGGNDSQILMGLPTLSIGAITAVSFMIIGIATEQILYHQGHLFYQKR